MRPHMDQWRLWNKFQRGTRHNIHCSIGEIRIDHGKVNTPFTSSLS